jgi:Plasmid pRiA4b ORF-3-like protein
LSAAPRYRWHVSGNPARTIHQLKIGLQGAAPPLWRRIQVPSDASLGFLHDVIQETFGWGGYHLHSFEDERGREWGEQGRVYGGYGAASADEEEASLGKILRTEGAVLWYVYDFGDYWRHRIEVEKVLPLDAGTRYPRCTGGRRAAPPAEDIGGVWGLSEVVYLVTHPEAEVPEDFEYLVPYLRDKGYDPAAFDPAELTGRLSGLTVRAAAKTAGTQREVQRLTREDLEFCTCGQCQAGDPVRSADGGYLTEEVPAEAEVFPAITLPPLAELAAAARDVPLVDDALRLAAWCAPGRQVTGKGVLRPPLARDAVEELRLWQRDEALTNPNARANALASIRSAGDLPVLDVPWRFGTANGLIAIRSGLAVPGPELPDPADSEQLLACWREALADELTGLDDRDVIDTVLKLLYRLAGEDWLDTESLISSPGAGGDELGTELLYAFVIESVTQLLEILSDFGAAEVDWEAKRFSLTLPRYRARLTALGRYGIRDILAGEGHIARVAGDLAAEDAATLLDVLQYYEPDAVSAELSGWLAGRDQATAVSEVLGAVSGTDPERAVQRVTAMTILTLAKPDSALEVLREMASRGPDGSRHVAAGVLVNLGEMPPLYSESTEPWLLVDLLTALSADDLEEHLSESMLGAIRPHADNLWRCGHPATADTLEAVAAAVRDSDKALAKRLRKTAYKARAKG